MQSLLYDVKPGAKEPAMELKEALNQIQGIRQTMARSEGLVGYRSASTGFTGLVALMAAGVQWQWGAGVSAGEYLALWIGTAGVSLAVVAAEMIWRCRRSESVLQRENAIAAAEQFVPCLAAGFLVTLVMAQVAPGQLWMLPGLWAVLFSLGIYSSRRVLPRGAGMIAGYYLLSGVLCLRFGVTTLTPPPWAMVVTFGAGQLMAAGLLYFAVERKGAQRDGGE